MVAAMVACTVLTVVLTITTSSTHQVTFVFSVFDNVQSAGVHICTNELYFYPSLEDQLQYECVL